MRPASTRLAPHGDPARNGGALADASLVSVETGSSSRARSWRRDVLRRRLLAVADVLTAVVAGVILSMGVGGAQTAFWAALFVPAWILLAKVQGLYDRDHRALRHLTVDEFPRLAVWTLSATASLIGLLALTPAHPPEFPAALTAWLVATAAAAALRGLARFFWRRITPEERVLIVGRGPLADATRRKLELFSDIHVHVVGQIDTLTLGDLRGRRMEGVDRIILASPAIEEQLIARLVAFCRRTYRKLSIVPPARGLFGTAVQLEHVADLPVIDYNTWDVSRSTLLLKRWLDVGVAVVALTILAPVIAFITVVLLVSRGGPVLFTQLRAGLGGRPFRIYKFRTMVVDAEEQLADLVSFDKLRQPAFKLENDPRVTRFGRLLRRTSLDELPQLFNVLNGDMSMVGPRPEQIELVRLYSPKHVFRLAVKPGLTGPMQVYGRGRLAFEERLAVEREYVENLSLGRDIRILTMTLAAVLTGRGAY
jgi:exopolysaccharide biosynthesis polyprenyl glycosylphosphotransferase